MKEISGLFILAILAPLLIILAIIQVSTYGISQGIKKIYDFIYFPIYNMAGKPFDTQK